MPELTDVASRLPLSISHLSQCRDEGTYYLTDLDGVLNRIRPSFLVLRNWS